MTAGIMSWTRLSLRYTVSVVMMDVSQYGTLTQTILTVDKVPKMTFDCVRTTLMRLVVLALDSDPSLVPYSSLPSASADTNTNTVAQDGRDPDDFRFWSERQARRIAKAIRQMFDVEYSPEVIVADANLSALANRILMSKEILH